MIYRRATALCLSLFAAFALVACGGGGAGASNDPPETSAPRALTYASPQTFLANTEIAPLQPGVIGSVSTYSVSPPLPAGLSLDATTGRISGAPTLATPAAAYTVTATNAAGSTTFSLIVKVIGVELVSGAINRLAAQDSPLEAEVVLRPLYFDPGTVYATANDAAGVFATSVSVAPNGDGTYSLRLSTDAGRSAGLQNGSVEIRLCRDPGCMSSQAVPSVTVAYSVRVLGADSPWPGDNRTALAPWPGAPDWSTAQGNAGHTGYVPVRVNPDRFSLRWRTGGNSVWSAWNPNKANLVTSNGLFYVVSSAYLGGGVVYAKREDDATEAWRLDLSGMTYPVANPAAVANGVVYFAAGHQNETYMFARSAADGSPVFRTAMTSQWESYYAPTIGPDGAVHANAGTYGGLYAFDPQGDQRYFAPQSQVTNWTPAVDATGVYAYTGDKLQVVNPLTGAVRVTILDPTFQNYVYDTGGAPVLGDSALGSVFGAAYTNSILNGGDIGNALTNFRTTTSSIAWQVRGVYPTTPAYRAGVVYAVNQRPLRLEARDESDGVLLWSWSPAAAGETSFVSEVLLTDNLAFVSTNRATHAIDLKSHRSAWSYPASGKLALSANGVLYIHSATALIAVNLK